MVGTKTVLIGKETDDAIFLISNDKKTNIADSGTSVKKRVLHGGLRQGMEIIEINHGRLKYWLLPQRGMGIWKAWLDGIEIGWRSPVRGPVHPQFVPIHEESGLGWLAGFDELLCRCGLESNGAPEFDVNGKLKHPLHGRIANLPAHKVEATYDSELAEVRIEGWVEESRFKSQRLELNTVITTSSGSSDIHLHDTVTNLSDAPGEFQLLYHINFGAPFLGEGAEVVAPVKTLVPRNRRAADGVDHWSRYSAPEVGFEEQVYFMELLGDEEGQSQVLLKSPTGDLGISLHFNLRQLPWFTLWKNTASNGEGYVTGLEPGTNFPNPKFFETTQGRVTKLAPGESRDFDIRLRFHLDTASVARIEQDIVEAQKRWEPQINNTMRSGWTIHAEL